MEWIAALLVKTAEKTLGPLGAWLGDRYRRHAIRRDIRRGPGEKIHILLARLAEDTPTDSYRTTVFETIRRELGTRSN